VVIALVAVITYLAVDLVYGGHFLAAAIALGEGFLAFTVLRAVVGPAGGSVLGFPLRREGRWTFAAVTLAGALALSAIPIAQAGAFRWLGWQGARLDPLARAAPALPGAAPTAPLTAGERTRLESAAASYALALALFPAHIETRLLLLRAYLVLGDPRAVAEAEEIARRSPPGNALARDALRAAYEKFGPPGAPARRGE
jgi:hypothetical protein